MNTILLCVTNPKLTVEYYNEQSKTTKIGKGQAGITNSGQPIFCPIISVSM